MDRSGKRRKDIIYKEEQKIMSRKTRKRHNHNTKKSSAVQGGRKLTKKQKTLFIAGGAALAVLVIAAVWWTAAGNLFPGSGQTAGVEGTDGLGGEADGATASDEGGNAGQTGSTDENSDGTAENSGENTARESGGADSTVDYAAREEMTLPYTVPGTGLVIDVVDRYSGIFIEDGSDEEVTDIFAVHVQNSIGNNVEYSRILLEVNGKELNFEISDLPAGASISVLESSRTPYEEGTPVYLDNQTAYIDEFDLLSSDVGIVTGDDNGLTVTNLTDEDIPCLRIFYKFVQDEEYLGGITYTAKIDNLAAGGSITIYPSHFAKDGSRIMMVRRYETSD